MAQNLFDEASAKREEMIRIFDLLPETVIYGVVGPNGLSAGKFPPEIRWSMRLELIAWRTPGTLVQHARLTATKELTDAELKDLQAVIRPESVIGFRGKLCERGPSGEPSALLIEMLDRPNDQDLEDALSEFRKPIQISDPVLGTLSLDKAIGLFEGHTHWLDSRIRISVSVDDKGDAYGALRTAKVLLGDMARWGSLAKNYAADKLLKSKNDNWLDGEAPITREEFIGRMRLESITAHPNGDFDLWHCDGDLFWGHSILVSGSLTKGITCVDIPG